MKTSGMFKNYVLTAARIIGRDKLNSLITLIGLSVSLAVALTIALYVWDETHVDAHQPDVDQLYRIEMVSHFPGRPVTRNVVTTSALPGVVKTLPQADQTELLYMQWSTVSRQDDPSVYFSQQIYSASPGFFDFFDVTVLEGDPVAVLSDPNQALITEDMRDRLFPNQDEVLGQSFLIDGVNTFLVGAVIRNLSTNTHLNFDLLTSDQSLHIRNRDGWDQRWSTGAASIHTYVKLADAAQVPALEQAIRTWLDANIPPQNLAGGDYSGSDLLSFRLRPVRDIHLQTSLDYRIVDDAMAMRPIGDPTGIAVMAAIGLVILLIGCINYVNLSTARALTRVREVAMRKVLGALRGQLIIQFLGESAIYVLIASLIGLGIVELSLDIVNAYAGKQMSLGDLSNPMLALATILLLVLTVLLAGTYPAFYLASIRPQDIWKQQSSDTRLDLRKILVIVQFAASITLMVCTYVFYAQTRFAQELDLGFSTDNVVVIYGTRRSPQETINLQGRLESAFRRHPGILSVAGASSQPSWDYLDTGFARRYQEAGEETLTFGHLSVDLDYFETFKIQPVAGRLFSDQYAADRLLWDLNTPATDEIPVVINESATRVLGYPSRQAAVGELIEFEFDTRLRRPVRIIGVVPDTHFKTIRSPIAPMLYYANPTQFNAINVRFDPAVTEDALAHIDSAFKEVLPLQAISRDFVDEQVRAQYSDGTEQTRMFAVASGLAIIVSILGLYGLAAYSAAHRTREISIRKVMGASTWQVAKMMLWQFSKSVLWANAMAWPLAWVMMSDWLSQFAYRINLDATPFILTGMAALMIACVTVAGHSIKVAYMSPVRALRYE